MPLGVVVVSVVVEVRTDITGKVIVTFRVGPTVTKEG